MSWPKTGATHYHAQLGFPDKGQTIEGLEYSAFRPAKRSGYQPSLTYDGKCTTIGFIYFFYFQCSKKVYIWCHSNNDIITNKQLYSIFINWTLSLNLWCFFRIFYRMNVCFLARIYGRLATRDLKPLSLFIIIYNTIVRKVT